MTSTTLDLETLASSCPRLNGGVVYQARAFHNSFYNDFKHYEDNCPEISGNGRLAGTTIENISSLPQSALIMLFPNPNNGKFYLTGFSTADKSIEIQVMDALAEVFGTSGYEFIEGVQISNNTNSRMGNENRITTSLDVINSDKDFQAYPNPTNGKLNVKYKLNDPTCSEATLQLMEVSSGRFLLKKAVPCNGTKTDIDITELPSGIFALSIFSNGTTPKTIRIVKMQ